VNSAVGVPLRAVSPPDHVPGVLTVVAYIVGPEGRRRIAMGGSPLEFWVCSSGTLPIRKSIVIGLLRLT
jgi:hypothetical protein